MVGLGISEPSTAETYDFQVAHFFKRPLPANQENWSPDEFEVTKGTSQNGNFIHGLLSRIFKYPFRGIFYPCLFTISDISSDMYIKKEQPSKFWWYLSQTLLHFMPCNAIILFSKETGVLLAHSWWIFGFHSYLRLSMMWTFQGFAD